MTKTPPTLYKQCPYCGKKFKNTDLVRRTYCSSCVKRGFHWVHEVTGRTNGWDKRVA